MKHKPLNIKPPTFNEWLVRVDGYLVTAVGVDHHDLPDCTYRDWYDDGLTPKAAAARAVANAKEG